jgi:hypothetical protein
MKNTRQIDRRGFIQKAILLMVGLTGSQFLLSACGNSTPYGSAATADATAGGNCAQNGSQLETTGTTDGHTHTITLTAADIGAANPSAVFTTSSTGHTHPVQLTPQQYSALLENQGVSMNTGIGGADGHMHTLTLNCA